MAFSDLYQAMCKHDCGRLEQLAREGVDMNCRDSMHRTVLHFAADEYFWGDIQTFIKKLVELGALVDAKDLSGSTPLHYSLALITAHKIKEKILGRPFFRKNKKGENEVSEMVEKIQISAVELFVQLGADVNSNYSRVNSLDRAILQKSIRGVKTLVSLGVVNVRRKTDARALTMAVMYKKKTLIRRLVELGADINWSRCHQATVHEALDLGRLDIVRILVENGRADINVRRIYDSNLIYQLILNEQYELVRYLADLGVDVNAKVRCCSLVDEAVTMGRKDILEYLVSKGAKPYVGMTTETALAKAVTANNYDLVELLLGCGADVNVRFDSIVSPLVAAMRRGNIDVVNSLARLLGNNINKSWESEKVTVLCLALKCEDIARMLRLLFKHGGDVNLKYDDFIFPIHDAVTRGDEKMVRALAKHGADLDVSKTIGMRLLDFYMFNRYSCGLTCDIKILEVLLAAGADVANAPSDVGTTSLIEAVRLGNVSMIRTLGELKADMNKMKTDNDQRPILRAIHNGDIPVVRYLSQNGCDVDVCYTTDVTPLHEAIKLGSVEMVRCLVSCGARTDVTKHDHLSALHCAIASENNEMVKCLVECGADINTKLSYNVNILHDAVEYGGPEIINALLDSVPPAWNFSPLIEKVTLLDVSSSFCRIAITETILKSGIDKNCLQLTHATPYDVAVRKDKLECARFLRLMIGDRGLADTVGSTPLHTACKMGHIDIARLLIVTGGDLNRRDFLGTKPLDCLPRNYTKDGHVLLETSIAGNITKNMTGLVSVAGCQTMGSVLQTPGIGDIRCIRSQSARDIHKLVSNALCHIFNQNAEFPGSELVGIGSAAEGTKVGVLDEMDFMFKIPLGKDERTKPVDFGDGYAKYSYVLSTKVEPVGSGLFHRHLLATAMNQELFWTGISKHLKETSAGRVCLRQRTVPSVKLVDRRACSEYPFRWDDDGEARFPISVDIVPSLHADSWPKDAIPKTWLMSNKVLRSRGYVLVAKPPHVNSDLAKKCTADELQTLWKISFPHLETEHMQRLEQRVKDVYLTAKCLRNPDVCRILIKDGDSLPRNVDRYITSYLLKMCFFRNVEEFRATDISLEAMVCKVYDDLVKGLLQNFIPLFFLPKVSALGGIKLDVAKSAKVAEIMLRFVNALHERDCVMNEETARLSREEVPTSVYKIYNI